MRLFERINLKIYCYLQKIFPLKASSLEQFIYLMLNENSSQLDTKIMVKFKNAVLLSELGVTDLEYSALFLARGKASRDIRFYEVYGNILLDDGNLLKRIEEKEKMFLATIVAIHDRVEKIKRRIPILSTKIYDQHMRILNSHALKQLLYQAKGYETYLFKNLT